MYASNHEPISGTHARPMGRDAMLNSFREEEHKPAKKSKKDKKIAGKGAPDQYVVYSNPDKTEHVMPSAENPCQIGHPSRVVVVGPPGCGKRSVILNLLRNSVVMFDTITVVHASHHSKELDVFKAPKSSRAKTKKRAEAKDNLFDSDDDLDEYDCQIWEWDNGQNDLRQDPYGLVGMPPIERFMKEDDDGSNLHNLLIMDEPPSVWNSHMERCMAQYFNYVSTHHNTTIFLVTQFPKSIPTSVRNAATHWVVFPSPGDVHAERFLEHMLGNRLRTIFKIMCRGKHDSIMVDKTGLGPRLRRNVYEPIDSLEINTPIRQSKDENDNCDFDCMRTANLQGGGQYKGKKGKGKKRKKSSNYVEDE